MSCTLKDQGQPLLVFDGAIDCLDFLLERLQLGSVTGAVAVPDLKATCPHCVASMVDVTDSFASSRDQDFPEFSKTFNVIAGHCVLLFRRHRRRRTAEPYGAEGLSDYRRWKLKFERLAIALSAAGGNWLGTRSITDQLFGRARLDREGPFLSAPRRWSQCATRYTEPTFKRNRCCRVARP
ncbi:hypothetical protein MES4922_300047 [Mesorhizobium ventifaucium]|uniref:Uncharacterized protein n=1 Tax=Mesorhizobium ventifaucium TaxID=666020 RepID=A0ABN8K2W6_9HYPH|nr:hypothetical protein MES4922_300047 [Mesorhizobium ventifaucium]